MHAIEELLPMCTFPRRLVRALISFFSRLANCLLSLHGVRPEMSALAASTEPKAMAAARAAAATAFPSCSGARSSAEHDAARATFLRTTGTARRGLTEPLKATFCWGACMPTMHSSVSSKHVAWGAHTVIASHTKPTELLQSASVPSDQQPALLTLAPRRAVMQDVAAIGDPSTRSGPV